MLCLLKSAVVGLTNTGRSTGVQGVLQSHLKLLSVGMKTYEVPPDYSEVVLPERPKLKFLNKVPNFKKARKEMKKLRDIQGPAQTANTFTKGQYGIVALGGAYLLIQSSSSPQALGGAYLLIQSSSSPQALGGDTSLSNHPPLLRRWAEATSLSNHHPPLLRRWAEATSLSNHPPLLRRWAEIPPYPIIVLCSPQALGGGYLHFGHMEMMRLTINRRMDPRTTFARWRINAPYKPITRKGLGQRMGGGKGNIDHYVTPVKYGRMIVEVGGRLELGEVEPILKEVAKKLPFPAKVVSRESLAAMQKEQQDMEQNNQNPWTFQRIARGNMLGVRKVLSPFDLHNHGKYSGKFHNPGRV